MGRPPAVRVFDGNGNEVPSQMGTPAGNSVPVTFPGGRSLDRRRGL